MVVYTVKTSQKHAHYQSAMFALNTILFVGLVLVAHFGEISACGGYVLKLNHAKNCIDDSVIKVENPGAILDKDCNLILSGCLNFPKGFKTAKGKYVLKKAPMPPMEGDLDFCEVVAGLDDPQLGEVAKMYNMPKKCPVPGMKVCGTPTKKINLSKFKNQLGIAAGTIDVKLEAEHDTGKTCIEMNVNLSRNKAARG